jgi:hypothetical protein
MRGDEPEGAITKAVATRAPSLTGMPWNMNTIHQTPKEHAQNYPCWYIID